jgi:hypothetical protein
MADVPNSWGEPDEEMRREAETALRGMIRRDFNHPAIFSWVVFNETWGLVTKGKGYLAETQDWVGSMYRLAKQLDPTRLVEDNSPCNYDHVDTDLNTWHAYLPGYAWAREARSDQLRHVRGLEVELHRRPHAGRAAHAQQRVRQRLGYEGSTGDVDWSWDYHIMMNELRRHPKVCGWLYTEHHDVHQRVERLLPLRPLAQDDGSRGHRAGHVAERSARAVLCGARRRALRDREARRDGQSPALGLFPSRILPLRGGSRCARSSPAWIRSDVPSGPGSSAAASLSRPGCLARSTRSKCRCRATGLCACSASSSRMPGERRSTAISRRSM